MVLVSAQVHLNLPHPPVDSASKLVLVLLASVVVRHRTNPHPIHPALASVLMLVSPVWVLALVSLMSVSPVLQPAPKKQRPTTVLHPEASVVLLVLVMLSLLLTPITTVSCLAVNSNLPVIRLFDRILI